MIDLRLGDTPTVLRTLPDGYVQCVVTSPPYWGLRNYGTDPQIWVNGQEPCAEHEWVSFTRRGTSGGVESAKVQIKGEDNFQIVPDSQQNSCSLCGAWRGELGLEPTPEMYVEHLVQIFREVHRVLKEDGVLFLNLGDSYVGGGRGSGYSEKQDSNRGTVGMPKSIVPNGLKPKDLVGIPWRVAFALQADGWYLRQDIIWHKPNPMPESVRDRCTKAHEYIFLLTKAPRYYYNADAIREPIKESNDGNIRAPLLGKNRPVNSREMGERTYKTIKGANKRDVWTVTTKPFKDAHFATFPPDLIEPCILAGSRVGDIVLDPFNGSGTTGEVAIKHHRRYLGIEIKPEYIKLSEDRFAQLQISMELEPTV